MIVEILADGFERFLEIVCVIIVILIIGTVGLIVFDYELEPEDADSVITAQPDLVMTMQNRTCLGFHNSEKQDGHVTTNWFCDDGEIFHDPTGVKMPVDVVYEGDPE